MFKKKSQRVQNLNITNPPQMSISIRVRSIEFRDFCKLQIYKQIYINLRLFFFKALVCDID